MHKIKSNWNMHPTFGVAVQIMIRTSLKKLQLTAARIATRLTSIASRDSSLYQETGCESLLDRRKEKLKTTMYTINQNLVPEYLTKIFLSTRSLA